MPNTKETTNTLAPKKAKGNSDTEFIFEELSDLQEKVDAAKNLPEELRDRMDKMLKRLNTMARMGSYSMEFDHIARYVDTVTSIPWGKKTEDKLDLVGTEELLQKTHYGMQYVKDKVLEYLSTMILMKRKGDNAISRSPVILFVGLQGVGKTTMAISLAEALGRKFVRVAIGAIGSVTELRGRSKAFPESEPGQVVKALIKSGVMNPVILLDEIEKASGQAGILNDVMAALLEILDPKQNPDFRDHYVDYPTDLSEVLFVCSANNTGTISTALMDRLEVIKMPSYTNEEKAVIARDYVFPGVLENSGLADGELTIDPTLWPSIVKPFGFDSGIRSIERTLEAISRKVAREIVEEKTKQVNITAENLKHYLPK
jgi:ATP-dependent Lon protease